MEGRIWLKRALIPFWTIQLLLTIILMASAILAIVLVQDIADDGTQFNDYSSSLHLANISAGVLVALTGITIVFVITEIILFARNKLRPVACIVLQSIKSLFWTFYFILAIIALAEDGTTGLSLAFSLILFLACIGELSYAAVIVHRHRKGTLYRGQYALTAGGAQNTGYNAPPFVGAPVPPTETGYAPGNTVSYPYSPAGNPFRDPSPRPSYVGHPAYSPYQHPPPTNDYFAHGQPMYEMSTDLERH